MKKINTGSPFVSLHASDHDENSQLEVRSNISKIPNVPKTEATFFNYSEDYRGIKSASELRIRNVGDKNKRGQIQISLRETRFFHNTNRTRTQYVSFSIPEDFVEEFLKRASTQEK